MLNLMLSLKSSDCNIYILESHNFFSQDIQHILKIKNHFYFLDKISINLNSQKLTWSLGIKPFLLSLFVSNPIANDN